MLCLTPFGDTYRPIHVGPHAPAHILPRMGVRWSTVGVVPGGGAFEAWDLGHLFLRAVVGIREWCVPVQLFVGIVRGIHAANPCIGLTRLMFWLPISLDFMGVLLGHYLHPSAVSYFLARWALT